MKSYRLLIAMFISVLGSAAQAEADVALITSLEGKVTRVVATAGTHELQAVTTGTYELQTFVKVKAGDVLNTTKNSKVQITYFENGRQESWSGVGKLEITPTESLATGLPPPKVKQIPLIIVKQMAHTPSLDGQERAGVTRLRSIDNAQILITMDETYKKMRMKAGRNDLNPELYLLAGMLKLKQWDRVEKTLNELKQTYPHNQQAEALIALYSNALRNAMTPPSQ